MEILGIGLIPPFDVRRSFGSYFTEGQRCAARAATFTWRELVQLLYSKLNDDAFTRVPGSEPKLTARQVVERCLCASAWNQAKPCCL
jgi:hypothetical protein